MSDRLHTQEALPAAVNQTRVHKARSEARMDQFELQTDMVDGERIFRVSGEAIERFAQMTNWDYYEAANRFQKVLEAAGEQLCVHTELVCLVTYTVACSVGPPGCCWFGCADQAISLFILLSFAPCVMSVTNCAAFCQIHHLCI